MKTIPEIGEILKKLQLDTVEQPWHINWEKSQAVFPGQDLFFIKEDYIREANNILQLPEDAIEAFCSVYRLIRDSEELARLAWHLHMILSERKLTEEELYNKWPSLKTKLKDMSGMFTAAVLVSGFANVSNFYKSRGIPREILIDTLGDLKLWMTEYRKSYGVWGMDTAGWLSNHFTCRLFKLGRLQFIPDEFGRQLRVYKNRNTGDVVAISEAGVVYRRDGLVDGTNGIFDTRNAWTAELKTTEEYVTGNPISPFGISSRDMVTLSAGEWDCVLSKGDPILDIHIPAGEKMSHELCGRSMEQAAEFFPRYLPEVPFAAFVCASWLLEPQLQLLLPTESNIVRFQKEFYLFPIKSDHKSLYGRVFGKRDIDIAQAPRDTTLQRAVADYVLEGNNLHSGAGFILKDDLKWGEQVYINQYQRRQEK